MKKEMMWAIECDHVNGKAMTMIIFRKKEDLDAFMKDVTPEQEKDMELHTYYPIEEEVA